MSNSFKLRVISSSSTGNAYSLDSGKEILLLEAGCKIADVKRAIDFRLQDVVGCICSHVHGDHSKYAEEYASHGIRIFCNQDVKDKKNFPYGSCTVVENDKTISVGVAGKFRVMPFHLNHDVPNCGFLIHHKDMGIMVFSSDTYKMDFVLNGVDHWLIEANYEDRILKANVEDGKIDRHQANRLMLSHMSLDNTIHYLHECHAEKSKTITLCHLSERNSDSEMFRDRVAGEFGVPTYCAHKGLIVEL